MKKTILVTLVSLLAQPAAHADIYSDSYAGIKAGYSDYLDQDCNSQNYSCDKKDLAFGFYAGRYFKDWFAVEASFSKLGSTYATAAISRPVFTATDISEISLAPRFDFTLGDKWTLFTKVGIAYVDINTQGEFYSTGKSDWVPAFAIGSEYKLTSDWRLRFDMSTTTTLESGTFDDINPMVWGIGLTYRPSLVRPVTPQPLQKKEPRPKAEPKPEPAPVPFSRRIYFEHGKSEISSNQVLDKLLRDLKANRIVRISLVGRTDDTGKDAYNLKFGLERAETIKSYLVGHGISEARITTESLGENSPVADNRTQEGQTLNRFVEIKNIPLD